MATTKARKLDVAEIERRLAQIKKIASYHDNEKAHRRTAALYISVLRAVAAGEHQPAQLARAALKAQRVKFTRYFA